MQNEEEWVRTLRAALKADRPDVKPTPILRAIRDFADWREEVPLSQAPDDREIGAYLADRSVSLGRSYAEANLGWLQIGAATVWSPAIAGVVGLCLRARRLRDSPPAQTVDDQARKAVLALPVSWQQPLLKRLGGVSARDRSRWSAAYLRGVAQALRRWQSWCTDGGRLPTPTGMAFLAYADALSGTGVSERSAADYLDRILTGWGCIEPGFDSPACAHVVADWADRGLRAGSPTKSGAQIVGASTIYVLGLDLVEAARRRGPRSLQVARDFRHGVLLMLAAALPQRARAIAHLEFGTTLIMMETPLIRIALPGSVIKQREWRKSGSGYDAVISNPDLWSALDEYRRIFRPLFDDSGHVFPSSNRNDQCVTSQQLGRLVGDLTARHLGVRVNIHRVRDNLATEASEELRNGGRLAPALLGHSDPRTTQRHYDQATGMAAARDHGAAITARRTKPARLRL